MVDAYNFLASWQLFPEKGTYELGNRPKSGIFRIELAGTGKQLAISMNLVSLEDQAFYQFSLQRNAEAKAYTYELLDTLGLRYVRSHANFVFFETGKDINALNAAMLKEQVQVGRAFLPYTNWCRVSTGTMEEMQRFGSALKKLV